ncbi:MAG: EamA family transporter [Anaerolineales bacterium]
MYYLTATIAIVGAVAYQFFIKKVTPTIHPFVNVLGIYLAVLGFTFIALLIYPIPDGIMSHIRKLNYLQLILAGCIFLMEIGFLLMYRYGWNLSTGNLVTGVFINISLVILGIIFLHEKITLINFLGIILSIIGVAMIGYHH